MKPRLGRRWTTAERLAISVLATSTVLPAMAVTSAAASRKARMPDSSSPAFVRAMSSTGEASAANERLLALRTAALQACLQTHPGHCAAARGAVGIIAGKLAADRSRLAYYARRTGTDVRTAPTITDSGRTLSWTMIGYVRKYLLVRRAPKGRTGYMVVTGTRVTPTAVPGTVVRYSVRTYVRDSKWAPEVSISYPATGPEAGTGSRGSAGGGSGSGGLGAEGGITSAEGGTVAGGGTTGGEAGGGTGGGGTEGGTGGGTEGGTEGGTGGGTEGGTGGGTGGGNEGGGSGSFGQPFVKGIDTNLAGWSVNQLPQVAAEMNSLGVNWEREDLEWASAEPQPGVYNWSGFEQIVAAAKAKGITVLPLVGYAPSWTSPSNAAAYAKFVAAAVARFGPGTTDNLQWWELWNEPYFAYAWSNRTPEPEAYAKDALAAAEAGKAVAPSVKFLIAADYQDSPQTGGSSPWETTWIDDMLTAAPTLGKWIDGVSVHPYGDDPADPLVQQGGWKDASGRWSFQRIDTIREKFLAHGVNLPFWITEEGWSTWDFSEATVAKNYADLIVQIRARPWIRALFPFCLREFGEHPTNNQPGFGLLKFGTWQPKAGYEPLQEGLKTLQ